MGSRIAIGVDVGGSGIKAAVVDVESGRFRSERLRVLTPQPSTPERVSASIARLVRRLVKASGISDTAPVGIGLPGVAIEGRLVTAANIDAGWVDYPIADGLTKTLKRPVTIVNDADAAGIAEMRFGIGQGRTGTVIFLTLGTGVGSGVFVDGILVPNTEFGQMEIRGRAAEKRSASAARVRKGLSWKAWAMDLDEHLQRIEDLMWPHLFMIGGGVSKNADKFIPRLNRRTPVVAATLRNDAGIIGAAVVAAEGLADASTTFDDITEVELVGGGAPEGAEILGATGPDAEIDAVEAGQGAEIDAAQVVAADVAGPAAAGDDASLDAEESGPAA